MRSHFVMSLLKKRANSSGVIVIATAPLSWQCPVGLDVEALSRQADLGQELAEFRTRDDEELDEQGAASLAAEAPAT